MKNRSALHQLLKNHLTLLTMALNLYLLLFLLLSLGLTFVWTSVRVYRLTGVYPVTFSGSDSTHDYAGKLFKFLLMLLLAVLVLNVFSGQAYTYLLPFWYIEEKWIKIIGLVFLHASLPWILIAQLHMGKSWRIGIDEKNLTTLITIGVFNHSRNPIFLGMLLSLMGIFLVLPNAFTLLILAVGYVLIQIQVRLEEEYLERVHEDTYRQYQHRVRRWL